MQDLLRDYENLDIIENQVVKLIIDEKNGYTLPNNASMFAEKIDYILKNENIQKQFSEYSYQLFTKHFTIEKMVDGYMNIYRSI